MHINGDLVLGVFVIVLLSVSLLLNWIRKKTFYKVRKTCPICNGHLEKYTKIHKSNHIKMGAKHLYGDFDVEEKMLKCAVCGYELSMSKTTLSKNDMS